MKNFAWVIFLLNSLNCLGQVENDTFNLLFRESDSLSRIGTYDVFADNPKAKKYQKLIRQAQKPGKREIEFYIGKEHFVYHFSTPVDTSVFSEEDHLQFITIEELEDKLDQAVRNSIDQIEGETVNVITKSHFTNVFLYEQLNDQQFIKYPVTWVEHIE